MYKGSVSWQTPMLYAIGFIGLFTIGGLTGLFLAAIGLNVHVTDTYFIIAHFHYIMVGGTIMGYLGGLHYWWPKISGRMYPEGLSKLSAGIIFIGFNLTFFPQFILGYLGMPRRYHAYPPEFQVLNVLSSAGASILGVGYLLPMFYLAWSLRYGKPAGANPWGASGPRVGDHVAAADREFRGDADRHREPVQLSVTRGEARCITTRRLTRRTTSSGARASFRQPRPAAGSGVARDVGVSADRNSVLRRAVPGLHDLPDVVSRSVRGGEPSPRHPARHHQHRRAHRQQPDDGAGGARGAAELAQGDHGVHRADDGARRRVPRHQGGRVLAQVPRAPRSGPALRVRSRSSPGRRRFSFRSTS